MLLTLLQIGIIIVCIVDLTDIDTTYRKVIAYFMGTTEQSVKVHLCSLCITWWSTLLYTILTSLTITNIMLCALIAVFTPVIQGIIKLIQDIIIKLIDIVYETLDEEADDDAFRI